MSMSSIGCIDSGKYPFEHGAWACEVVIHKKQTA